VLEGVEWTTTLLSWTLMGWWLEYGGYVAKGLLVLLSKRVGLNLIARRRRDSQQLRGV